MKTVFAAGTKRAIHVLTPALVNRLKNGGEEPLMAVRSSEDGYKTLQLFRKVTWHGPTQLMENFEDPLPGTSGRGVAVIYTTAKLICTYEHLSPVVKSNPKDPIEDVYERCKELYNLFTEEEIEERRKIARQMEAAEFRKRLTTPTVKKRKKLSEKFYTSRY